MAENLQQLAPDVRLKLYHDLVKVRTCEEKILEMFTKAMVPRHSHLSIGQEAVAVGVCANLRDDDYITSTHRGHGHLLAKGGKMDRLLAEIAGREDGYCRGKGGSMHIADFGLGMLGAISIVGAGIPIAVGAGLSAVIQKTDQVAASFFGEGAVNQGTFNEGLNMAALWKLPVIFVCENNYYEEYHPGELLRAGDVAPRAEPYGMPGISVDGNDVVAVYQAAQEAVARARAGEGPTLLECRTYRRLGHNTNDPAEYMPPDEIEAWKKRDPITLYRGAVLEAQVTEEELTGIDQALATEASGAMEFALDSPIPAVEGLATHLFAPAYEVPESLPSVGGRTIAMREALIEAMMEEMERDESVILLGEDVGEAGGVFKTSAGLWDRFGTERVIDTPISESGYTGAAIGAALTGMRPVAEIMFTDLVALVMDPIVNFAAKIRYMTGGQATVPVVFRMASGGGFAAGATHSQSLEAWFYHIPGLKVAIPATPYDLKGLLKTAIREDNPVVFLEHKGLYNTRGPVPEEEYLIPFGVADVKREGTDITVIATSKMVLEAMSAADTLAVEGISLEVIDPRTLVPLDWDTISVSVRKTGRVVIFEEACKQGSVGGDIAAQLAEREFDWLDAPIIRVGARHVPFPFSPDLEQAHLPNADWLIEAVRQVMAD
jgi:pyruvate/2-oxoglutarate/acetoin dehydrogenase E1 component/TPP-dependent pyruvate/acetoin dehydrogenase alpha subunit